MNEDTGIFDGGAGSDPVKWYHYIGHLGFYVPYFTKAFFSRPFKEERRDLDILDTVRTLLESETTELNIDKSKELTRLHRVVENTRARRRLEKWSLRVIASYLLAVLAIVLLNYTKIQALEGIVEIPSEIMITILSTTTVNIIGLGLIVLRGHFLANDSSNSIEG